MDIEVTYYGKVSPKETGRPVTPYEHQRDAMRSLDIINKRDSFSTLIVLPTGGGKTSTATRWLLRNAIDRQRKVLWLAHRTMLLDQAAESFRQNAYPEVIPHISSFSFRIVSGAHDRSIHISSDDDVLIAGKDSLGRNLSALDKWIEGEDEIFFVIDEAHHSVAKTYRNVIGYLKGKNVRLKIIGLTATPFRTAEEEQGLLGKIFRDGVNEQTGEIDHSGIAFKVDLKELINRHILASPITEECKTDVVYGASMGQKDLERVERLDSLPDDVAEDMAGNNRRNKLIVTRYVENQEKYGQTIVFVYSILHAIQLRKQFELAGVPAAYVVSNLRDMGTNVTVSQKDNKENIQAFIDKKIHVLINVNILTEGVDLPQTQTVFLTRPTVSMTLMTQMVGRALRGEKAGGTRDAYIVSFIDDWQTQFSWVSPSSLFADEGEFEDNPAEQRKNMLRIISIAKIEEFAALLDGTIDDDVLEKIRKVPFDKRVPIGMYILRYQEQGMEGQEGTDVTCQIMVYDSTLEAYRQLMEELPALFDCHHAESEYLSDELLDEMERECHDTYFCGEMIPPYARKDVLALLKFYAQKRIIPTLRPLDEIHDRIDLKRIAQHIVDEDMGPRKKIEYINHMWDDDDTLLAGFFGRKRYFIDNLENEILKITLDSNPPESNVTYGRKQAEDMTLMEVREHDPELERQLRDTAFEKSLDTEGMYHCASCGKASKHRIYFQVDHIIPLNKGGKTKEDNLQILCRHCNGKKGDS